MTSRSIFRRLAADERGSLPLALLAMLMASALLSVVLASAVNGQGAVRRGREFSSVLAAADGGVHQAVFRLNASKVAGNSMSGTATLGEASVTWQAQRIGVGREWVVVSTATRNGQRRTVETRVLEERKFFASAFANSSARFNGGNTVDSYTSGNATTPFAWPDPSTNSRLGVVGSNGLVDFQANISVEGVQLWNFRKPECRDTLDNDGDGLVDGADGGCSATDDDTEANGVAELLPRPNDVFLTRCPQSTAVIQDSRRWNTVDPTKDLPACDPGELARKNPPNDVPYVEALADRRSIKPTAREVADKVAACSRTVDWTNRLVRGNPQPAVLTPVAPLGDPAVLAGYAVAPTTDPLTGEFVPGYYCYRNVTFAADTTLHPAATADNPVVIYATGNVSMDNNGTKVNCEFCVSKRSTEKPPVAGALQIYLSGAGTFTGGPKIFFGGTVIGPEAQCGKSGNAQNEIYGSLICETISGVGGWGFYYDRELENIGNRVYHVSRWTEQ